MDEGNDRRRASTRVFHNEHPVRSESQSRTSMSSLADFESTWNRRAPYSGSGGAVGRFASSAGRSSQVNRRTSGNDARDYRSPLVPSSHSLNTRPHHQASSSSDGMEGISGFTHHFHTNDSTSLARSSPYPQRKVKPRSPFDALPSPLSTSNPSGGFSGRRANTALLRRSAPPHLLHNSAASESDRYLDESSSDDNIESSRLNNFLNTLNQHLQTFFLGSSEATLSKDFTSTLTSNTTLASRIVLILCVLTTLYIPSLYHTFNQPMKWDYSRRRKLGNRNCVMNLYIEKQAMNEFNPDYVEITASSSKQDKNGKIIKQEKTGGKSEVSASPQQPTIFNGTHRTKGQVKVISRFIESVANSYRSNFTISQHLIFTNARDGGYLAEKAFHHWPLRGIYPTQLHVVAADETNQLDGLQYGMLDDMEKRFKGNTRVHVYDRSGMAGLPADDDEAASLDLPEGDYGRDNEEDDGEENSNSNATDFYNKRYRQRRRSLKKKGMKPYPNMRAFFQDDDDDNSFVPYLHVDGENFDDQLEILDTARPLLLDSVVAAVGIEHSPDLNVFNLIDFFTAVNYKTFFLGSRQIHRLDHLCPEMLEDILSHPYVARHPPLPRLEHLVDKTWKFLTRRDETKNPIKPKQLYPPFFVALPRGRIGREEMTIQHMYDLFGGLDGGGGQIKTANDRKAPGKK